jgi:hypothetical protein
MNYTMLARVRLPSTLAYPALRPLPRNFHQWPARRGINWSQKLAWDAESQELVKRIQKNPNMLAVWLETRAEIAMTGKLH